MFSMKKTTMCGEDICSVIPTNSISSLEEKGDMLNPFRPLDTDKWIGTNDGEMNCFNMQEEGYSDNEQKDIMTMHTKIMNIRRLNSLSYSFMKYVIVSGVLYKFVIAMFVDIFNEHKSLSIIKYILMFGSGVIIFYSISPNWG